MYSRIAGTGFRSASFGSQSRAASLMPSDMGIHTVSMWRVFTGRLALMVGSVGKGWMSGGGFQDAAQRVGVYRHGIGPGADIACRQRCDRGEVPPRDAASAEGRRDAGPAAQIEDPLMHGPKGVTLKLECLGKARG